MVDGSCRKCRRFKYCKYCKYGRDFSATRVLTFKLLMQELQSMNAQMRIIIDNVDN